MRLGRLAIVSMWCGFIALRTPHPPTVPGIRFTIGSTDLPSPADGVLVGVRGTVEFAEQKGRFDLIEKADRPALSVSGITVAQPAANPGDYYLFDSTRVVLVRPRERAFSVIPLTRSWVHLGNARDPSEGFMEFTTIHSATLPRAEPAALSQRIPFVSRWHLDRLVPTGPADILARGWYEVSDAPVGEATVVRWFGAAWALSALGTVIDSLPPEELRLTEAVVASLPNRQPVNLIALHPLRGVARADIDPSRLAIPLGFTQSPWPVPTR